MKFGAEFHAGQINAAQIAQFNGSFVFSGTETGVDSTDFLISTFVPGAQSIVFPGAPPGILYPGDPGRRAISSRLTHPPSRDTVARRYASSAIHLKRS